MLGYGHYEIEVPLPQLIMTAFGSSNQPYKNINVVLPSLSRFRAFSQSSPDSGISKKGIVNDAENLRCAIGAGR